MPPRAGLRSMFGCRRCSAEASHPSIAGGRVPLTLRLLSPAHRLVQTTKDLPGFWRGSYGGVRRDMRGRYPKHPWPEDPLSAPPPARQATRLVMQIPTIEDVRAAAKRIEGIAVRTPLLRNDALDDAVGARVFVKAECLQRGGAFKMRGAANALAALAPEVRARGVLAFSSGNHAIAVATAARHFGVGAVIVMPADAPAIKLRAHTRHGRGGGHL